jgi:hypothetical protein
LCSIRGCRWKASVLLDFWRILFITIAYIVVRSLSPLHFPYAQWMKCPLLRPTTTTTTATTSTTTPFFKLFTLIFHHYVLLFLSLFLSLYIFPFFCESHWVQSNYPEMRNSFEFNNNLVMSTRLFVGRFSYDNIASNGIFLFKYSNSCNLILYSSFMICATGINSNVHYIKYIYLLEYIIFYLLIY